jgi:hypothetical protein
MIAPQAGSCGRLNLDRDMNAIETEAVAVATVSDLTDGIREIIAAQISGPPPPAADEEEGGVGSDNFASLIKNISATSMAELDRLIGELQQAKAFLQSEGERIERETLGYVELSQTALESVKIISETVCEWRKAGHPVRGGNGASSDS